MENNIEFILQIAGINNKINDLTEYEKKFIREKLIPHYEYLNNPVFGNEHTIINQYTGEVKTFKTSDIVEGLKNLVKISLPL